MALGSGSSSNGHYPSATGYPANGYGGGVNGHGGNGTAHADNGSSLAGNGSSPAGNGSSQGGDEAGERWTPRHSAGTPADSGWFSRPGTDTPDAQEPGYSGYGGYGSDLPEGGLPVRVPQASLAPQLREPEAGDGGASPYDAPASAESVRNTMSALQRGWELGRGTPGSPDADAN
jgi:hypothetical protein